MKSTHQPNSLLNPEKLIELVFISNCRRIGLVIVISRKFYHLRIQSNKKYPISIYNDTFRYSLYSAHLTLYHLLLRIVDGPSGKQGGRS